MTAVTDKWLQFSSTAILPTEGPIATEVTIYEDAQYMVYIEADQSSSVSINGSASAEINPFPIPKNPLASCRPFPGVYMLSATVYELSVTNESQSTANIFIATVG